MYQQPVFQPPRKRLTTGVIVAIVAGALALILVFCGVIGVIVWRFGLASRSNHPTTSVPPVKVGDCLTNYTWDPEDVRIVDCADKDAKWHVVEVLENQSYAEAKSTCSSMLANTYVFYDRPGPWDESTKGTVVCLIQKRRS